MVQNGALDKIAKQRFDSQLIKKRTMLREVSRLWARLPMVFDE